MTCRELKSRMKRFLRTYRSIQFCTVIVLIIYLYYIVTCLVFPHKEQKPRDKPQPLFTIPSRPKPKNDDLTTIKATNTAEVLKPDQCPLTVAIILCEDDRYLSIKQSGTGRNTTVPSSPRTPQRQRIAKDFSRQINQTLVLLKSIAILSEFEAGPGSDSSTPPCVEALLLSDKPTHYQIIQREIRTKWSTRFQKLVKVTNVPVRYPPGSSWMKNLFRPCATLRLFLAELLPPEWDSVVYLDTDVIFFQSLQALWSQFDRFDDEDAENEKGKGNHPKKVAAMAPCLVHYGTPANSIPYFGTSGLNAGIMLMNLTRMRASQWTNKIRMVTTMFQSKIKLADQDILNIYFHFFPEELHVLSCDWNFRPFQCRPESYCDDPEISQGISALHGNALSFTPQGPEPLFHSVFQAFHRVKLNDNFRLTQFVKGLESSLLKAEESARRYSSQCKQFGGFDVLLLNRLYGLTER